VETGRCLKTWEEKERVPFKDYPNFYIKNRIIENKIIIIKEKNQIKIIDLQIGQVQKIFLDIPGLFIQGCSFKNLHPDSQLSDEEKELLKMYGGVVER
jgi:hypothetical protein